MSLEASPLASAARARSADARGAAAGELLSAAVRTKLRRVSEPSESREEAAAERGRVLALLERHGWNATSFQILEPAFSYWFAGDDACVAYVDTGAAWVAAGAPIGDAARLESVAREFVSTALRHRRRACFFGTERRFLSGAGLEHVLIGEQPVWDPREWRATLRGAPSLREQLRRARAKGVRVSIASSDELSPGAPLRREIEALIAGWQGSKSMPPMGFLVHVDPFGFSERRRSFVARTGAGDSAVLVGFAAAVPVYARNGWFVEDLIRAPSAPNGTTELLVDAAMNEAAALGSTYFTLGLSPLAGDVSASLGWARRYASPLYDFGGLWTFKAKFRPREWAPIYLSYPSESAAWLAVYDSLRAFAQRGLLGYGLETLLRGPDLVLGALAWLLLPWTALLASLDSQRWFPAPWVQWAWVGFDLALCAALVRLYRHHDGRLSRWIVLAVTLDAAVTLIEAIAFNLPRTKSAPDIIGVAIAVAAPAIASRILANAHRRASRVTRLNG
jgi:phosphatidylglycerol lysyltransferase